MNIKSSPNNIAFAGVLTALALIFSYLETFVPMPVGVPGIKPGFANVVILIGLYTIGTRYALTINILRIVMAGILFSGIFGMMYSLAGGIMSLLTMAVLKKFKVFSIFGVSIAGGVVHNLGQIIMASVIISNIKMFVYFPVLVLSGIACGALVGAVSHNVLRMMPKGLLNKKQ